MDTTKRRKLNPTAQTKTCKTWTTQTTQQLYSTKLIQALRQVRQDNGRDVRTAADRALAMAAKGRTRWSRAILASRVRVNRLKKVNRHNKTVTGKKKLSVKLPAVERKVKVLSRLVPGCRGIGVSKVLEETGDYIAALEMQVRAMKALTELLMGEPGRSAPFLNLASSELTL